MRVFPVLCDGTKGDGVFFPLEDHLRLNVIMALDVRAQRVSRVYLGYSEVISRGVVGKTNTEQAVHTVVAAVASPCLAGTLPDRIFPVWLWPCWTCYKHIIATIH